MKINCIIIDDEPLAISVIKDYLDEFNNFNLLATFSNPLEAVSTLEEYEVDVVFLDINMSKMSGLEFIKTLENKPNIVITTAYREYAVESYELDVLDYLVKPIPFNRFLKSVNKITQQVYTQKGYKSNETLGEDSHFFLKVDKKLVKIIYDQIYYIESLKDYIKVFTTTDNYLAHKSLTSITEEIPKDRFLRVHRSYTIALNKIKSIEGNSIEINSKRIPIGRKYVNSVKKIILHNHN